MIKAILFDMDGVLIESEDLTAKAAVLAFRDFGVEVKETDFLSFLGGGDVRYFGGVAAMYGKEYDPAIPEKAYEYFGQRVIEEAHVPAGVVETLNALKAAGYKIAVCTSAPWMKVIHNLRGIGVEKELFDAVINGDQVTHNKPDPEIYLKGAEMVGCAPEECMVVEDAINGIKAGHAGGMKVTAITSAFSEDELRERAAPEYIIHDIRELLGILQR